MQPTLPVRAVQAGLALPNGEEEGEANPDGSRLLRRLYDPKSKQKVAGNAIPGAAALIRRNTF